MTAPRTLLASLREKLAKMTPRPWRVGGRRIATPMPDDMTIALAESALCPEDAAGITALVNTAERLLSWAEVGVAFGECSMNRDAFHALELLHAVTAARKLEEALAAASEEKD